MAYHRQKHHSNRITWRSLKDKGLLSERYVLMAQAMEMKAETIEDQHRLEGEDGSLLLEWIEDQHLAKFGSYVPDDGGATPESQAEDASLESLVPEMEDFSENIVEEADFERALQRYEEAEKNAPMSVGEITKQDAFMLNRQADLRKAAVSFAARLEDIAGAEKMWLFGSVALPLWKEVPCFSRFRTRRVKIYHHCQTIDLALEVTDVSCAPALRKALVANCRDLVAAERFLGVADHMFSVHLVEHASKRYLGMVCHYNQCPKGKVECQVPGCGKFQHVRILPWFHFKPERLNPHNSLVLFERGAK